MIYAATPAEFDSASYRKETEAMKMVGVQAIPGMTLCVRCGHRRTTMTGGHNKHGSFVCHSCGKKK